MKKCIRWEPHLDHDTPAELVVGVPFLHHLVQQYDDDDDDLHHDDNNKDEEEEDSTMNFH